MKKPRSEYRTLINKADRVFSIWIRTRDADENGYCHCCSCGRIAHYKEMDAGHFVNRSHMNLRYNETNVNAQCRYCNRFDEGNNLGYATFLTKKHGSKILKKLQLAKYRTKKFNKFELQEMIKFYKANE